MKTVYLLFFSFLLISSCSNSNTSGNTTTVTNTDTTITTSNDSSVDLSKSYSNEQYGIITKLPEDWKAVEKQHATSEFALNILPADKQLKSDFPLSVHADDDVSFISVWPEGFGTELPAGASKSFRDAKPSLSLPFEIDEKASTVFLLNDGKPWAYFIKPASTPANWTNGGFVFAQIKVNNVKTTCYDKSSGNQKDMSKCDPLTGDKVVKEGEIDEKEASIIRNILSELNLKSNNSSASEMSQFLKIEQPKSGSLVKSPLIVKGSARGFWYFEAQFQVNLLDANGKEIASSPAKADGEWMTENFVPFSARLTFTKPSTPQGKLVFERANPSGLKENAKSFSIPVTFN